MTDSVSTTRDNFDTSPTTRVQSPLVELKKVSKRFGQPQTGTIHQLLQTARIVSKPSITQALDHIDLDIHKGEVVGLVGESGCGKSTLGRIVTDLIPPTEGDVLIEGRRPSDMNSKERLASQLKIQMVFQNPYASLNPRLRVSEIVGEAPLVHGLTNKNEVDDYVCAQLERTGLDPSMRQRYPHQFSGGQRQRVGIARALAVQPEMLVCDEAVAALDVSIQAQILNLFMDLREQLNLTYLFISHDLGVVKHIADRVVIMYLGRIVEMADTEEVFSHPNHPYTQILLDEIPHLTDRRKLFTSIKGEIPSPLNPPTGCHFHPRCPKAMPRCKTEVPKLKNIAGKHLSACHLNDHA